MGREPPPAADHARGAAGRAKRGRFAAWRRFFEALADWGPLVLVFEDLHWADSGLLDFLDHLADWAKGVPIVLLCTARPELLERRSSWVPVRTRDDRPTAAELIRDRHAGRPPAAPEPRAARARDALIERAEGNPLYAEEFVRMLVDRGLLYRVDGDWRVRTTSSRCRSRSGIIASRVDALQRDEKTALRDAAVIGRGFWPAAVAAVAGLERAAVEPRFSLERKDCAPPELERGRFRAPVSFHHAVVRDVAYSSIPRVERAEKHRSRRSGSTLGRREDHAETIAHHYLSASSTRSRRRGEPSFADRARERYERQAIGRWH